MPDEIHVAHSVHRHDSPGGTDAAADPIVQFVVGAGGSVDSATIKIIADRGYSTTRRYFQQILRSWQFTPATLHGCPVSELLQMPVRP